MTTESVLGSRNLILNATPPPSRWQYLRAAMIIFVVTEVSNLFGQMSLVQELELKYSSIACGIGALVVTAFLFSSPLTRRLTVDHVRRVVTVDYVTPFRTDGALSIPFDTLNTTVERNTEGSSNWKMWLLSNGQNTYLLLSSETGFTAEAMNEFLSAVQSINNSPQREHAD